MQGPLKITLISPPMIWDENSKLFLGRRGTPPMSLAYLAGALEKIGTDYQIIDAISFEQMSTICDGEFQVLGLGLDDIVEKIDDDSSIIGISSMFTSEWVVVSELARKIKEEYPHKTIVVGGEHPTVDYERILKFEKSIDVCFLGESDDTLIQFIQAYSSPEQYQVEGIAYRDEQGNIHSSRSKRISDINELIPSWKKIDLSYYHNNQLSSSMASVRSMPILATRGCPYKCTFCTNETVWGIRYVMRAPHKVIEEMKFYQAHYGVSHFDFLDMAMNINKAWFSELLDLFIEQMPGITWQMEAGSRSEILDWEILDKMYRSGNRVLDYAPETGSEELARKIKKRISFPKFFQSVEHAVSLGFFVKANLIIGFPHETWRDVFKTVLMAFKLGLMGARGVVVFLYAPMIGTEISEERKLYKEDQADEYFRRVKELAGQTCVKIFSIKKFFINPKREFLAILANVVMALSYLLSWLHTPLNAVRFFKNVFHKRPEGPFEMAFFLLIKRFRG